MIVYYLRGAGQIYCLIKTNCDCLTKYLMKSVVDVVNTVALLWHHLLRLMTILLIPIKANEWLWDTLCYSFLNQDINQWEAFGQYVPPDKTKTKTISCLQELHNTIIVSWWA